MTNRVKDVRAYRHPEMNFFYFQIFCRDDHKTLKNEIKNGGHRPRLGATDLNKDALLRTFSHILANRRSPRYSFLYFLKLLTVEEQRNRVFFFFNFIFSVFDVLGVGTTYLNRYHSNRCSS